MVSLQKEFLKIICSSVSRRDNNVGLHLQATPIICIFAYSQLWMSLPPSPAPTKSVNTEKNSCPVTPPASLDQDLFPSLLVLNLYVILIFLCLLLLSFLFVFYTIIDCAFVLICISKRTK